MQYFLFGSALCILTFSIRSLNGNSIDNKYHTFTTASSEDVYTEQNSNSMLCIDMRPQTTLDMEEILGLWYGNEIIMHTQGVPGVFHYESCVLIHLADVTQQMRAHMRDYSKNYNNRRSSGSSSVATRGATNQYYQQQYEHEISTTNYLRLVWSEGIDDLEYTFNYTDLNPGQWLNVGEQRGSLMAMNKYTQFSGTVQVVKAVSNQLVLTFCGNDLRSSIYTIVLSRTPQSLSEEELRSIRNLLSRRGLNTDTVRKVCDSAAAHVAKNVSSVLVLICGAVFALWKYF
ncbi:uncharacterized protein LOC119672369 [Teleopsis dalmanni]|uniref:uncharacterized protein LOC119672369 n=1 Tax=Teleopsis dalmanni TaxID=139649 RepID=UPI0018CEB4D1|nr:uncharacterized protein LOC119672369 [Teleopsis dalmanni]